MPPLPATKPAESAHGQSIEQRFRQLEAQWLAETAHLSSTSKIVGNANFREIVAMGQDAVPLMLRDLEQMPRLWVWALPEITGADPVPPADRGNIAKMSEAWVRWGRANGYLVYLRFS